MSTPPPGSVPPPPPPPGQNPFQQPPQYGTVPPGYQPYTPYQTQQFGALAGFWVRFGGYLLDGLLYGLLAVPLMIPGIVIFATAFDDCVTIGNQTTCPTSDGGSVAAGSSSCSPRP